MPARILHTNYTFLSIRRYPFTLTRYMHMYVHIIFIDVCVCARLRESVRAFDIQKRDIFEFKWARRVLRVNNRILSRHRTAPLLHFSGWARCLLETVFSTMSAAYYVLFCLDDCTEAGIFPRGFFTVRRTRREENFPTDYVYYIK